jgi:1,2-phenylacetyl-CoA epoxidase catalytic subunit
MTAKPTAQDIAIDGGLLPDDPMAGMEMPEGGDNLDSLRQPRVVEGSALKMYTRDDPDMPEEFRQFMVKLLKYAHVENNGNPHYRDILADIAEPGIRFAPDGRSMMIEAEILKQEVAHGEIVANILRSLGEDPYHDQPVGQYAFFLDKQSWCDLSWFHMLIDRVGLYVGIEWMGSTYEPLAKVADQLEKEEYFHATAGFRYLKRLMREPENRIEVQEKLHKWWPAALDMFGRSDSKNSEKYVKWGIKAKTNEELRQQYISDTVPLLDELELDVPDHRANRKYL